ncbi:MAG: lamin tail domain-containing protein, partial [Bacteroidota bacterium]
VNLEGWQVADGGAGSSRPLTTAMHLLASGEFLVLTGDSAAFAGVHPDALSAVLFVPQLPSLNNTGDDVVLYDRQLRIMDSLRYLPSWGGKDGKSLERVDPRMSSISSANWGPSQDPEGSTPGRRNSIMRLAYDLLVDVELPIHLFPKIQGAINAILRNVGGSPTDMFELLLYHDRDGDSTGESGEIVAWATVTLPVEPGDSLDVPILWTPPDPGRHEMILAASWEHDMRSSNNAVRFAVEVSYPRGSIIINEFLYEPLSGSAEFVELLNATERSIDLEGWSVRDGPTEGGESRRFTFTGEEEIVGPGELFLLSSDTSLFSFFPTLADGEVRVFVSSGSGPGLNNSGDSIVLCDPSGRSVDSLAYDPSWHNPSILDCRGRSLEKLAPGLASTDARSWSTSLDPAGATPGRPNSLTTTLPTRHSRLSFAPNPFSPDNDGVEDFVIVHYEMPVPTAAVTLTVYDARGRMVRRLLAAEAGARQGEIVWDGRNEERGVARVGVYVVVLEALDETGGSVISARGVVVLACRLE